MVFISFLNHGTTIFWFIFCQEKDSAFLTTMLLTLLYVRVVILLTCGKHLHDHIISLRGEVWAHKTSVTQQFLLKCLYYARRVSSHLPGIFMLLHQESEQSFTRYIYVTMPGAVIYQVYLCYYARSSHLPGIFMLLRQQQSFTRYIYATTPGAVIYQVYLCYYARSSHLPGIFMLLHQESEQSFTRYIYVTRPGAVIYQVYLCY